MERFWKGIREVEEKELPEKCHQHFFTAKPRQQYDEALKQAQGIVQEHSQQAPADNYLLLYQLGETFGQLKPLGSAYFSSRAEDKESLKKILLHWFAGFIKEEVGMRAQEAQWKPLSKLALFNREIGPNGERYADLLQDHPAAHLHYALLHWQQEQPDWKEVLKGFREAYHRSRPEERTDQLATTLAYAYFMARQGSEMPIRPKSGRPNEQKDDQDAYDDYRLFETFAALQQRDGQDCGLDSYTLGYAWNLCLDKEKKAELLSHWNNSRLHHSLWIKKYRDQVLNDYHRQDKSKELVDHIRGIQGEAVWKGPYTIDDEEMVLLCREETRHCYRLGDQAYAAGNWKEAEVCFHRALTNLAFLYEPSCSPLASVQTKDSTQSKITSDTSANLLARILVCQYQQGGPKALGEALYMYTHSLAAVQNDLTAMVVSFYLAHNGEWEEARQNLEGRKLHKFQLEDGPLEHIRVQMVGFLQKGQFYWQEQLEART